MTTQTERQRQEQKARELSTRPLEWIFRCEDGEDFRAVAPSESGAFCVLNAERPWMRAEFVRFVDARA